MRAAKGVILKRRIVIIGGGYSGACAALTLAKSAQAPAHISIIEPREQVGAGIAYSNPDPALRLNVEDSLMVSNVADIPAFPRWLTESGSRAGDPDGEDAGGQYYARRHAFSQYMAQEIAQTKGRNPSESTLSHVQGKAMAIQPKCDSYRITLENGEDIVADLVILALGNDTPATLQTTPVEVRQSPSFIANPWREGALDGIVPDSKVLLVGSGLTAVDVVASLDGRGHQGTIKMISRRGLIPQPQGVFAGIEELLRRNMQPVPAFIQQHGTSSSVLEMLRWVRADIAEAAKQGAPWHEAVDAVRDAAKHIWPTLAVSEKRRFHRHLRPYYDAHRFRVAPQINAIIQRRFSDGQLMSEAAQVVGDGIVGDRLRMKLRRRHATESYEENFDFVIVCTGPSPNPSTSGIALLRNAVSQGLLAPDPSGIGLAVNARCETLDAEGEANIGILCIGPQTKGAFAEVVAVPQITMQMAGLAQRLMREHVI
jgi:uncharacterized NAD(P)/FAD-binding protein YdhS